MTSIQNLLNGRGKHALIPAVAGVLLGLPVLAHADTINLGSAANYSVIGFNSLHDDFSLVTVNGNVAAGDTSSLKIMAPSKVNGNVQIGTNATFSDDKPGNVSGSVLTGQDLSGVVADAKNAFATYSSLAPTQTFSGIGSQTTITGNGGTNVIDINGNIKNGITLAGSANDIFVLNVTGGITLTGSQKIAAGAGINSNQILINLIGSNSVNTHVGDSIDGTVIAPNGSGTLDGTFNGRLFFGGSSLTLMSGAVVNQPPTVPLPAPVAAAIPLLGGLAAWRMSRQRKLAGVA